MSTTHRSGMSRTTRALIAAMAVQGLLTVAVVVQYLLLLNSSGQLAADRGAKAVTLAGVASENRDEVSRLGGTPIGPDPGEVLRGDPGVDGTDGAPGPAGPMGPVGRDGRDATPEQIAAAVAAYLRAHPPKPGAAGEDGVDGQSPACLAEVDQCRGATGATGERGADGAAGSDGQPAAWWRWTDPVTTVTYECRRDPNSPDNAPGYACTAV